MEYPDIDFEMEYPVVNKEDIPENPVDLLRKEIEEDDKIIARWNKELKLQEQIEKDNRQLNEQIDPLNDFMDAAYEEYKKLREMNIED